MSATLSLNLSMVWRFTKSHKEVQSPEKLRKTSTQPSLLLSPTKNENRVEPCHNCDMDMSPNHLCQDSEDSEADEVPEAPIICCCGCGAPERCPRHFEVMESRKQLLNLILEQTKQFNFKWPKGQLWPGESCCHFFVTSNNVNSFLPCHYNKILLLLLLQL